jgi:hypothetical protein
MSPKRCRTLQSPRPAFRPPGVGASARRLLREQLANGPKPGALIEAAAEISERSLIAAADALGVSTQRGQWWVPG